jgi:two-component system response regulator NreC
MPLGILCGGGMIKIAIADDHAVVRDGIRALLHRKAKDMEVITEASNGKEMVSLARKEKADVYIIDISMPVLNGIETIEQLLKIDPKCKVVILSMHDDRRAVEKAFKIGAKGFIVKVSASDDIIKAIREVYKGRFYLCPRVSQYLVQGFLGNATQGEKRRVVELTSKEREILQLIAEGYSSKDIAKELELALNTVHVHRHNMMTKLNIHKQAELIRYALKEGISQL